MFKPQFLGQFILQGGASQLVVRTEPWPGALDSPSHPPDGQANIYFSQAEGWQTLKLSCLKKRSSFTHAGEISSD